MANPQLPGTHRQLPGTHRQAPGTHRQAPGTYPSNPQSPIPNHYACLYAPPQSGPGGGLTAIAQAFSPRFQQHRDDLVVIDIAGLERLLGPARVIGEELRRAIAASGIRAHVAIAATQTVAMVLAHARPGLTVVAAGGEAEAVAPVAIGILSKFEVGSLKSASIHQTDGSEHPDRRASRTSDCVIQTSDFRLQTFQKWGIRTLGELAALPAADLVARMGREALAWQAIARGEDVRPLIPTLEDERFDATLELEWPIEGLEPLSFVLTRLLEPLSTRLERRDRGAAVLHVLLDLVKGTGFDRDADRTPSPYTRRLELPTPMRDVRALRTLALLDLESHPPDAAIERVTIVIDPTPGRVLQHTLFARAHPTPEQLSTLIARLGAVMGQDRVGAPAVIDTHRPGAFGMTAFATVQKSEVGSLKSEVGSLKSEVGSLKSEVGSLKSEVGSLKSEVGSPKFDEGNQTSDFRLQTSNGNVVSALRRCRQPVPARVAIGADGRPVRVTTDRRGFAGGAVLQCAGPWRTSGNWWTSDLGKSEVGSQKLAGVHHAGRLKQPDVRTRQTSDFRLQTSSWDRDEWDVALSDGAVYRVFRDRESDGWFIDAIVD